MTNILVSFKKDPNPLEYIYLVNITKTFDPPLSTPAPTKVKMKFERKKSFPEYMDVASYLIH